MGAIDYGHFERRIAELGASNGNLLGFTLRDANMQLTTDQLFEKLTPFTRYRIDAVVAVRKTGAFSGACAGGVYAGANKSGLIWVPASQSFSGLTGANKLETCTLGAPTGTDVGTTVPRLSLTTGNGAALTADFFMFVQVLD